MMHSVDCLRYQTFEKLSLTSVLSQGERRFAFWFLHSSIAKLFLLPMGEVRMRDFQKFASARE
jgi:hypothetical protein